MITREADSFLREEIPGYPELSGKQGSWFGYGIVSVYGNLYSTISKTPLGGWSGPFRGFKLLKSSDNGNAWYRVGRTGDELLHIYSSEGAHAHKLTLARVPKERFGVRSEWKYFKKYNENNQLVWTDDITHRGYVHEYPEKSEKGHYFGWYSWLPSVEWNEELSLYVMVNGSPGIGDLCRYG